MNPSRPSDRDAAVGGAGATVRSERVRLAIFGFGRVGQAVLELALTRSWLQVVAVIAQQPHRHGEATSVAVARAPAELRVRTDEAAALAEAAADVIIIATVSRLADVLPNLRHAVEAHARAIICTSEELAYIRPEDGPEADAIHRLARSGRVPIVATGVNPGFVLDLWPLALAGLAWNIDRLEASRVVDVSVFAPHTRRQLGIGFDEAAFRAGVEDGSIAGHLGFRESLRLLCAAMGREPDSITVDTEPIIADREYRLPDATVAKGLTIGASQRAVAWHDGRAWIDVGLLLHAAPHEDGIHPTDETHIYGRHELHATLDPGAGAILSTAAQLVNMIPAALRAGPGVYGPGQLPPSPPWLSALVPPATQAEGRESQPQD